MPSSQPQDKQPTTASGKATLAKEVVAFGMVGVFNAVLNYAVYAISLTLGAHWLVASILGYVISVFSAWVWQYFVVFREGGVLSDEPWWRSVVKTYITYATTGLILNNILLFLMLDVIHIENFLEWAVDWITVINFETARDLAEYISPLIVMVLVVPINFLLNKFWAFGKKK